MDSRSFERNHTNLVDLPYTIREISAIINVNKIEKYTDNYSNFSAFARIGGYFYNAMPGEGGTGDIAALVAIGDFGDGPRNHMGGLHGYGRRVFQSRISRGRKLLYLQILNNGLEYNKDYVADLFLLR